MDLVLGVDAGGTATRAVLATTDGTVVGRGHAGPGNPVSAGSAAALAVGTAISQALAHTSPDSVTAAVLGVAGVRSAADPAAHGFTPMWRQLGLTCPLTIVGDVVTAFAAGTPARSGTVLIAGTGAIAARVTDHRVTATADGLGWLLGDEGGGRWIGLQTVRAAVRDWSGPLGQLVAACSGTSAPEEAVRWAQSLPLSEIGALTRPVCAAARSGTPAATRIIAAAVDRLIATLDELAPREPLGAALQPLTASDPAGAAPQRPDTGGPVALAPRPAAANEPVVLAGSLLVADTPVRDGVLGVLEERETPTGTARDPAAGAAWLAACRVDPRPSALLHSAMLGRPVDQ